MQPSLRKCKYFSGSKPAGPKTSVASCGPPGGRRPARATFQVASIQPNSLTNSQPKSVVFGLSPIPPRRSAPGRQGRRFCESRYSLSAQSPAKSTAQIQTPCSARHGSKTDYGFRAQRTTQPKALPNSPPRVRLTAAPLALRRAGARLSYGRVLPLRRAGGAFRHSEVAVSAQIFVRAHRPAQKGPENFRSPGLRIHSRENISTPLPVATPAHKSPSAAVPGSSPTASRNTAAHATP